MGHTAPPQQCDIDTCTREIPDTAYICHECGTRLVDVLLRVPDSEVAGSRGPRADLGGKIGPIGPDRVIPGLASSLDVAITKQARFTQLPGGTPAARPGSDDVRTVLAETALPFGYAASEARTVLTSTLATWTNAVAEQRGLPHPAYTLVDLALFLADQVPWLRQQPAGHEAFEEITAALRNAWRTVDRPMDRVYAGPCNPADDADLAAYRRLLALITSAEVKPFCTGHLYAREDSVVAVCDACAREMPLDDARAPLLDQIDGMLLSAREIEKALGGLGSPVNANTIRTWAHRGLLTNRAGEGQPPRYSVRDVRTLAETRTTRTPNREAVPA